MVSSRMKDVVVQNVRLGTRKTGLERFFRRKMFRGIEMGKCLVQEELKLMAEEMQ